VKKGGIKGTAGSGQPGTSVLLLSGYDETLLPETRALVITLLGFPSVFSTSALPGFFPYLPAGNQSPTLTSGTAQMSLPHFLSYTAWQSLGTSLAHFPF
jgi:hypothetical protein